MESRLLSLFGFLFLVAVVCDAALPAMVYWNTMLPGVPMPKVVRELLPGNLQTTMDDGKQQVYNILKKSNSYPGEQSFNNDAKKYWYHSGEQPFNNDAKKYWYHSGEQPFNNDAKKYWYHSGEQPFNNDVKKYWYHSGEQPFNNDVKKYWYHSGVQPFNNDVKKYWYHSGEQPFNNDVKNYWYHSGEQPFNNDVKKYWYHSKEQPFNNDVKKYWYHSGEQSVNNNVKKSDSYPNWYHSGKQQTDPNVVLNGVASKDEVHEHENLFFLEKDLITGSNINVDLIRNTTGVQFIPRQLAEAYPFSIDKLSEALELFSLKTKSVESDMMEETIKSCNRHSQKGDVNHCATSLESMVDFIVNGLGRNVQSLSTEIGMAKQQYTSVQKVGGSKAVVCHRQDYPYAVFFCHAISSVKVYKLQLSSNKDDSAVIAMCHHDTSTWNPGYMAFKILNLKPGNTVCHFLPEGNIIWTSGIETSS